MTDLKLKAGADAPRSTHPAVEMKSAMAGFLKEFNAFQDDVKTALQQQEERQTMLDRKTMTYGRPTLSALAEVDVPHKKAFGAYLRSGDDDGMRGLVLEGKALSTAVAADGGYLIDPKTADTIKSMLSSTTSLRSISTVVNVEATSFDVLIDRSDVGAGWATETTATTETATPIIERISIRLHQLSAMPKASQRLLDDSAFDVEGWLAGKIAERFIRAESAAFVNGDGIDKPKGFLLPTKVRAPEAEMAGRIRLGFIESAGSYEVRQAEAVFPDETSLTVSQSDMQLVLTANEARSIAERWLTEARVARDTARFALPKSALQLGSGDVVALEGHRYRIDRVEQAEAQLVEAVRIETGVYQTSDGADERVIPRAFTAPVPVFSVFLDLPLLSGDEVPHAPHVAVTADPWPGSVGVWSAPADAGYELNRLIAAASVIGTTETVLARAPTGLWDRGPALRVKMVGGTLSSSDQLAVFNGANVIAVGDGSAVRWEVLQFSAAVLVAPSTYDLSLRLRGQQGTDGIMPAEWPVGSTVVLLDLAPQQIELALSSRGLARYYRIGAAGRGYDDPAVVVKLEAFDGIGLRPYPVAHLNFAKNLVGDLSVSWIRRTRIDGDSWQSPEVPLGEAVESYIIRVVQADVVLREETVSVPNWGYLAALQSLDGIVGAYRIDVAQVSDRFGSGPFRSLDFAA